MAYLIKWNSKVYKQLKHINSKDAVDILNAINILYENPCNPNLQLIGNYIDKYRIRIGDYRVIYSVDELSKTVLITSIGHRKDIYK